MRRLAAAAVVAAVFVTAPLVSSRAAEANETCTDGAGVSLVVDFGSLGGGVNLRCAGTNNNNGYDVFNHANVSYETVSGKDFVCRIAGKPNDANCSTYPAGDYYWSYWWAKPGQDWQYASRGAGAHKPSPGAYEGWSFVSSDTATPPRYPPPPAPTTTTSVASPPSSSAGSPAGTEPPSASPTTRASSSGAARTTTVPAVAAPTNPSTSTSISRDGVVYVIDPSPSTSVALGHVDLTRSGKGGGTSVGFLLSGLAIVGLGAFAVAFLRTRGR